ncbi:MAG: 23S rRNA (adenine(2503)-C(2))-methyltransferase RlmN [Spirochaetaceae bacterium]|jgi:23S rRNA (adenine2503-C2)-methyltransferase|nr:23S rRNA (adenine(2503)-C(2))-methyltransferase RlmN [Spirochaetaceae bacterium]
MEQETRPNTHPSLLAAFLDGKKDFFHALAAVIGPQEPYRAAQLEKRLVSGAASFDEMTELPKTLRETLSGAYVLRETAVADTLAAEDGTVKLKIRLADGAFVEAVLLSDGGGRRTACLSTQTGCPAGCVFCKTGSIAFKRNLSATEIAEQFFHLREAASRTAESDTTDGISGAGSASPPGTIANIVVMGMGEPLLNLEELRKALLFLEKTGEDGRFSPRRVTVSTSGIIEGIRILPDRLAGVRLALSLTTADEELRRRLMPIARANPLSALKEALRSYQSREKKRITLEAVLLGGINTRTEDAVAMAAFARDLQVIVNLIPWNPVDGLSFEGKPLREPSGNEAERFAAMLHTHGIKTELRRRKGRGVCGACGQLGGGCALRANG